MKSLLRSRPIFTLLLLLSVSSAFCTETNAWHLRESRLSSIPFINSPQSPIAQPPKIKPMTPTPGNPDLGDPLSREKEKETEKRPSGDRLVEAAVKGDIETVRNLLKLGIDPNTEHSTSNLTALMEAAWNGQIEMLQELIRAGADVKAVRTDFGNNIKVGKGQIGWTALMGAVKGKQPQTVEILLREGANINFQKVWDGISTGITFMRGENPKFESKQEEYLLRVYQKPNHCRTPLILAAENNDVEMLRLLLKHGANPYARCGSDSAMSVASEAGSLDAIRLLINEGVDPNARVANGQTPLMVATGADTARLLIKEGADVNAKSSDGRTPLMMAADNNETEVIKVLVKAKANINAQNKEGETAIMIAIRQESSDVVPILLQAKPNLNITNKEGATALMYAVHYHNSDVVPMLLQAKPNLNMTNKEGATALMYAVYYHNTEAVRLLLQAGANVHATTPSGESALTIATDPEIVKLLREYTLKTSKKK